MRFKLLTAMVLFTACSEVPEANLMSNKKPSKTPDLTYRLSADDRRRVASQYDANALEEFLQMFSADERPYLIKSFQVPDRGDGKTVPDVSVLTGISDPELQAVLDRVWAPRWARIPLEELERADPTLPGVKAALAQKRNQRAVGK